MNHKIGSLFNCHKISKYMQHWVLPMNLFCVWSMYFFISYLRNTELLLGKAPTWMTLGTPGCPSLPVTASLPSHSEDNRMMIMMMKMIVNDLQTACAP